MRGVARLNLGVPTPWGSLLLLLLLAACGEPVATPEPVFLQATGSTAMSPLLSELAVAFEESSPLISLEVSGLGTQFGLEALRSGEADVALVSWLPAELDPGWQATAIARDAIAIVVHPSNPVDGLGLVQLQDLFGGGVYEWVGVLGSARALGTVQPVSREAGSGTRTAFEALVMVEREVTPWAIVAPSSRAVIEYVTRDPHAIGYVSLGYVTSEVKVLEVEGELPTPQTAQQGSYPLTRDFWLVTADPPLEAVQDFLDFALGQAGQQIVSRHYGRIK